MQALKHGPRYRRPAAGPLKSPAISRRRQARSAAHGTRPTLERQLVSALHDYQCDTPEDAFPSFLEALHCDNLR
jgi:hypothetical protein